LQQSIHLLAAVAVLAVTQPLRQLKTVVQVAGVAVVKLLRVALEHRGKVMQAVLQLIAHLIMGRAAVVEQVLLVVTVLQPQVEMAEQVFLHQLRERL
jgi:hypothetical protein